MPGVHRLEHVPARYRSQPHKVICSDGTDSITINFFNIDARFIHTLLKTGAEKIISGKLELWNGMLAMTNPDIITTPEKFAADIPQFEPVYPLTSGITNNYIRKMIAQILTSLKTLDSIEKLPDWLDTLFKKHSRFPDWIAAVENMHNPKSPASFDMDNIYRKRLAYDEILSSQMALGLIRNTEKSAAGVSINGNGEYRNKLLNALNFKLTDAQENVLREIFSDMSSRKRMLRLMQGDVGSGKTIVALLAILNAVECGYACVLMAPTEILATQHAQTINEILLKASLLCLRHHFKMLLKFCF